MNKFYDLMNKAKVLASKVEEPPTQAPTNEIESVEDTDIITQMLTTEFEQQAFSSTVLTEMSELLRSKSSDYGPVATVLDVLGKCTGYQEADVPLSENAGLTRLVTKVVRYMTLRAKKEVQNYESIDDTLKDLIGEATRLYTTYMFNKEVVEDKIVEDKKVEK